MELSDLRKAAQAYFADQSRLHEVETALKNNPNLAYPIKRFEEDGQPITAALFNALKVAEDHFVGISIEAGLRPSINPHIIESLEQIDPRYARLLSNEEED